MMTAMRRAAAAGLLAAAAMLALPGCQTTPEQPVIAVIQSTGGTAYWSLFADAVAAAAKRNGYRLEWSVPQSAADYEVQAQLLNDALQRHVSGIILAPSHQLVLAEGVRRARAAGIPVVVVDTPIAVLPEDYTSQVGCSDEVIGFLAAQRFSHLGKRLRVLVIGASPTLQSTEDREEAMRKALLRSGPGIEVVGARYSLSDWARARQVTLDALAADKQINAIFSSDDFSSHGVLAAVRQVHLQRQLNLVAVQSGTEARDAVDSGLASMVLACDSATMGQLAMEQMKKALDHRPVEKLIQTEVLTLPRSEKNASADRMFGLPTGPGSPPDSSTKPLRSSLAHPPALAKDHRTAPRTRPPLAPS